MVSISKEGTPRGSQEQRHSKSRTSNLTKKGATNDLWQDNIHFARVHEDPDEAMRLAANSKLVNDHDKFVEYIRHVESKCNRSSPEIILTFDSI